MFQGIDVIVHQQDQNVYAICIFFKVGHLCQTPPEIKTWLNVSLNRISVKAMTRDISIEVKK